MDQTFTIQDTKKVWVAWTNTDLTEGRGYLIPLHVCESYETAERLGKRGSVQGSNCGITEELAVKINGHWHAPTVIKSESKEDKDRRKMREDKDAAIARAKAAGLSDSDIAALRL